MSLEVPEGEWVDAIIPGRGLVTVFVPDDDEDSEATQRKLFSVNKAASLLRKSRGFIEAEIKRGTFEARDAYGRRYEGRGRPYITRASLDQVIQAIGIPSDLDMQIEAARACHNYSLVEELREAASPAYRDEKEAQRALQERYPRGTPAARPDEPVPQVKPQDSESFLGRFLGGS
jgi:hypothetical protein